MAVVATAMAEGMVARVVVVMVEVEEGEMETEETALAPAAGGAADALLEEADRGGGVRVCTQGSLHR